MKRIEKILYHKTWLRYTFILFFVFGTINLNLESEEAIHPVYEKADKFVEQGDYKSALGILLEYSKTKTSDDVLFYKIGFCYFRLEDDKNAQTYFEKAIQANPKISKYYDLYAASLYFSGKVEEAEKQYLKCIELDPNAQKAISMLGSIYFDRKNYIKSKEYFQKAVELDSEDLNANYNLARIYFGNEEFSKAEKYLEISYKLDPGSYGVVSYLLENTFKLGKFKEVDKYKKVLVQIRKNSKDARLKNLKYFRFDSFKQKDYFIVAQESFLKEGDAYSYYIFSVYDKNGKLVRNINLESSVLLKEHGLKYIIGTDFLENGSPKHSTSTIGYPELPSYEELKNIIAEVIDGKVNFPSSSSSAK